MTIQWYPGHMHKAQKDIKQALAKVDIVIEVLDARIPFSSENPLIATLRGEKPCIKVLNKWDLADPDMVKTWQTHLEKERGVKTLALTKDSTADVRGIISLCKKLLPNKVASVKKMRAMIVGIPNVGKSTLINILAGRAVAKTGNEPAVTKAQQHIQLDDDLLLLDTPGILWPKQTFEHSSYRLAATGAIKDTAMEYEDVAFFIYPFFRNHYAERLQTRYEMPELPDTELAFFEALGKKRGCLGGGGRVNLNKVSQLFIHELRAGVLGRLCLESPEMIEKEVLEANELARIRAEEAEKRKR